MPARVDDSLPRVTPPRLAALWGALAATYGLLPLGSGLAVRFSAIDLVAALVFWGVLGVLAGLAAQRFARAWLGERRAYAWALAATAWAVLEAVFTVIVVVKPTRWPPLGYTLAGIGVPAALAAASGLRALRRAARGQAGRVTPAIVIVASWATLAALLLWAPRWLRALGDAPGPGWVAWGLVDLTWILTGAAAVTVAAAAVLATRRRRMVGLAGGACVLAALQLLPIVAAPGRRAEVAAASATPRPDIVWIIIDSMRNDHVSAYGYPRPTMPALARLAADGTLVRAHVSAGSRTENTYAKTLTLTRALDRYEPARPVPLSAVRALVPAAWLPEQPGLIAELQHQGYETALFHVYQDLLEDRGLQPWLQSFDELYKTRLSGDASLGAYVARMAFGEHLDGLPRMDRWAAYRRRHIAEHITGDLRAYLRARDRRQPLFLIVHLAGGHDPHYVFAPHQHVAAPATPHGRRSARYDDALRAADDQLAAITGDLAATLPGANLFVFADHGTLLPNEPRLPASVEVPLLVIPPLPAAPGTVTSTQDIAATTLALASAGAPRCDAPLGRDLRCPGSDPARVVDHTGRGRLILATLVDGVLSAVSVAGRELVAGDARGVVIDPCRLLRALATAPERLAVSPLETREGLPARLRTHLAACTSGSPP